MPEFKKFPAVLFSIVARYRFRELERRNRKTVKPVGYGPWFWPKGLSCEITECPLEKNFYEALRQQAESDARECNEWRQEIEFLANEIDLPMTPAAIEASVEFYNTQVAANI